MRLATRIEEFDSLDVFAQFVQKVVYRAIPQESIRKVRRRAGKVEVRLLVRAQWGREARHEKRR